MSIEVDGAHTVGRWLRDRAASNPKKVAIDDRGVAIDYATLARRSEDLAQRLAAAGYGAGQRIATVSGNSADHVVAFFACAFLGIAFIPLSWRLTPTELAELVRRSAPDLLLVEDEYVALAEAALRMRGEDAPPYVFLGDAGVEAHIPTAETAAEQRSVHDDDALLVIFTSGSEAAPKGVVLTHASCFWTNMALTQTMPMIQTDVVLSMLPQYHVAAWNVQPLLAWWTGATVVLERSFQPGRVLQLIRERRVTTMMGVPTQYRMLMETPGWSNADLSSLRHVLVGGATMPVALARAWAERGVELTQGYGLTEPGPMCWRCPHRTSQIIPAPSAGHILRSTSASSMSPPRCPSRVRRRESCGCADRAPSPGTSMIRMPRSEPARTAGCVRAIWPTGISMAYTASSIA